MKTVYIVLLLGEDGFGHHHVRGVYSTREKAEKGLEADCNSSFGGHQESHTIEAYMY